MNRLLENMMLIITLIMLLIVPVLATAAEQITESQQKEFTAQWWQWVMSINDTNILLDQTGEKIMQYEPTGDNVYFLTGAYNSNLTRNVTIPAGQTILLPVLNGVQFCLNCSPMNYIGLRDALMTKENINNNALMMEAELNGKTIPYVRITSELFDVPIIKNNPIYTTWNNVGDILPALADGYWVVLKDLQPGYYDLYTHGVLADYSTEVRYNIEIK